MSSIRIKAGLFFSFGVLLMVASSPANAWGATYCTNCSTRIQQAQGYVKQALTAVNTTKQLAYEIKQYNDMLTQGESLSLSQFLSLTSRTLGTVNSLYNQSAAISGSQTSFSTSYATTYPGYSSAKTTVTSNPTALLNYYKTWSTNGLASNKTAMQVAGTIVSQLSDDDSTVNTLVSQSQSASGRMQAIQVSNQLLAQVVQQLQKITLMLNAQIQNQGTYYAQTYQKNALHNASTTNFFDSTVSTSGAVDY